MIAMMGRYAPACCARRGPITQEDVVETIRYGPDVSQFAELSRPRGTSRGVVVIIHGGFWSDRYGLSLGRPLARSVVSHGWTAYNVEYRRVGSGGGWPTTFDDIASAVDHLAQVPGLGVSNVITLGHSAGGHLAVWAAGRSGAAAGPWAKPQVSVTAAISQAGVLDFDAAITDDLGGGAVQRLMGGTVDDRYTLADPTRQLPLRVPVRCIHGMSDHIVPLSQSTDYVGRAKAAGADADLVRVEGDHFVVIDPNSPAWATTLEILETR